MKNKKVKEYRQLFPRVYYSEDDIIYVFHFPLYNKDMMFMQDALYLLNVDRSTLGRWVRRLKIKSYPCLENLSRKVISIQDFKRIRENVNRNRYKRRFPKDEQSESLLIPIYKPLPNGKIF